MMSRRDAVLALAATGAVTVQRRVASALDTDAQTHHTPINFRVPPGACDCHVHVFCDPRQFSFSPDRTYTPPPAPVEELRRVLRELHMDRVVIVSPDSVRRLLRSFMGSNQVAREYAGAAARLVLSSPTRSSAECADAT